MINELYELSKVLHNEDIKTQSWHRKYQPIQLEKCSEEWTLGCANLPPFPFGTPKTLYPLDIADVLNRFWKQSGEVAMDKFKPVPQYHGIEILMDSKSTTPFHTTLA